MRRILALASLLFVSAAPAFAQSCQSGFAQVVAAKVMNVGQVLLPSGTLTITGIDATRAAINFGAPGGGVVTKSSIKAPVANGSIQGTVCVPRSDKATVYVRYHITIADNSIAGTRAVLVDANDVPITTDVFSLDNYTYPANAYQPQPNVFTNGQVNGNLAVTGTITAGSIAASTASNANHANSADTATSAANANHANAADNATHATSADTATSASSATSATSASTAVNANHAAAADSATQAGMATQLAALPATCPNAGDKPNGVDAKGNAVGCSPASGGGGVSLPATNTLIKGNGSGGAAVASAADIAAMGSLSNDTSGTAANASHAAQADTATNATHATAADSATTANSAATATTATSATSAATATQLAAVPTSCPAGQKPVGIDAKGNAIGCSVPAGGGGGGTATPAGAQYELQTNAGGTTPTLGSSHAKTDATGNLLSVPGTLTGGAAQTAAATIDGSAAAGMLSTAGAATDINLQMRPKGNGQFIIGPGGHAMATGTNSAAALALNNGTNDSPNLAFYFAPNQNLAFDVGPGGSMPGFVPGPFLRMVKNNAEAGGAVIGGYDQYGNFGGYGALVAGGGNDANGYPQCSTYFRNPDGFHPIGGLGTCTPQSLYNVAQPGVTGFTVNDPTGHSAFVQASGTQPKFALFSQSAPYGLTNWHSTILDNGQFANQMRSYDGADHTVQACNGITGTNAATDGKCVFPYGYLGAFNLLASDTYTAGQQSNYISKREMDWGSLTPSFVVANLGTIPNFGVDQVRSLTSDNGFNDYNSFNGPAFKFNYTSRETIGYHQTAGQHVLETSSQQCFGAGDCLIHSRTIVHNGGGIAAADEQVHPGSDTILHTPNLSSGNCSTGCTTGAQTLGLSGMQFPQQFGQGMWLADSTAKSTIAGASLAGYTGVVLDPGNGFAANHITGGSLPVSQIVQGTTEVSAPAGSVIPGTQTITINTTNPVAPMLSSTSALPASGIACIADYSGSFIFEIAPFTKTDASHLSITFGKTHHAPYTVAVGGLCGYGMEEAADAILAPSGNAPLHFIAPVYGSPDATTFWTNKFEHMGVNGNGHGGANLVGGITNFVRANNVDTITIQAGAYTTPDAFNGLPVNLIGNNANISGVTLTMTLTDASSPFLATYTAIDARANYSISGTTNGAFSYNNLGFYLYPIAEILHPANLNNSTIVVGPNLMPLATGHALIQSPQAVQANGNLDEKKNQNYAPSMDVPIGQSGCELGYGGGIAAPGDQCNVVVNSTPANLTLGEGGTHAAPQFATVSKGFFNGGARYEIRRGATGLAFAPPSTGGASAWGFYNAFDFGGSTTVPNQATFTPNPAAGVYGTLDFQQINVRYEVPVTAPIVNSKDGAFTLAVAAGTASVSSTFTSKSYLQRPKCATGVVGPQGLPDLHLSYANDSSNNWTVTAQFTAPTAAVSIDFACQVNQ